MAHGTGADGDPLILVVDDNAIGAMLVEDTLADAGLGIAGPFQRCSEAGQWLETSTPRAAILDIKVLDGSCTELARTLRERGVPIVLHTAWTSERVPEAFEGAPRFAKPSAAADLLDAMKRLIRKHHR